MVASVNAASLALMKRDIVKLTLILKACRDLPRADGMMGLSDPFAIIYWNDREIGTHPGALLLLYALMMDRLCHEDYTNLSFLSSLRHHISHPPFPSPS